MFFNDINREDSLVYFRKYSTLRNILLIFSYYTCAITTNTKPIIVIKKFMLFSIGFSGMHKTMVKMQYTNKVYYKQNNNTEYGRIS